MAKSKKGISKNNLPLIVSILSLIIALATFVWVAIFWNQYWTSFNSSADEDFKQIIHNAMQDQCINNAIKPCTREAVNAYFEAKN